MDTLRACLFLVLLTFCAAISYAFLENFTGLVTSVVGNKFLLITSATNAAPTLVCSRFALHKITRIRALDNLLATLRKRR